MNRFLITMAISGGLLIGAGVASLIPRPPTVDKRMDAVLGRVFIVDNVEYISARKYHVADHVVCVGQGQRELILHVAAIENIVNLTKEASK